MILIGENIHIISKKVKEALENKDENFIKNLIKIQEHMDCIDLNIGPAKGKLDKIFNWLCRLAGDKNISFDSSNKEAIAEGIKMVLNPSKCFINSTSADEEKLDFLSNLALKYDSNLIALTMKKGIGIPKDADGRMELVFEIYEKCMDIGLKSEKLYFDPLVLPVKIDNTQAQEVLNTIKMIKESFEPKVNTIIGLSNISNGAPNDIRALINRVFCVMAYGAGLDCAIVDALDYELVRIISMLDKQKPESKCDELYLKIANMVENFGNLEEIIFDKNDVEQENIIKTADILLGNKIYSDSFTQV